MAVQNPMASQTPSRRKANSPLGEDSDYFRVKSSKTASILDDPEARQLEFYPAGYTKITPTGYNRQNTYQKLFGYAAENYKEETLYPLGKRSHEIVLVPEPNNEFDPNAILVFFEPTDKQNPLYSWGRQELGYVPMRISKLLRPNLAMIKSGKILKVRCGVHGKYFHAKVVLSYDPAGFSALDLANAERFRALMDE